MNQAIDVSYETAVGVYGEVDTYADSDAGSADVLDLRALVGGVCLLHRGILGMEDAAFVFGDV